MENLEVKIFVDYLTNIQILNEVFTSSISYKVQDNFSDTLNLENRSVDSLLDKIYQEFLIQLTANLKNK